MLDKTLVLYEKCLNPKKQTFDKFLLGHFYATSLIGPWQWGLGLKTQHHWYRLFGGHSSGNQMTKLAALLSVLQWDLGSSALPPPHRKETHRNIKERWKSCFKRQTDPSNRDRWLDREGYNQKINVG